MQDRAVLLVNDDPDFREAIRLMLEAEGLHVVTASNPADAMERAKTIQPVLIMTAFQMPAGDGVTFLSTLRERGLYEDVPKVIFSSEDPAVVKARMHEAAVDAPLLYKLSDIGLLLKTVREAALPTA
jgi:two-component system, OmpR family, response regulator